MPDRLVYQDVDKRIYVVSDGTYDTPPVERYEWVRTPPSVELVTAADALAASDLADVRAIGETLTATAERLAERGL